MAFSPGKETSVFHLENSLFLEYLPSGSAMAVVGDRVFIAGDDSPYLFALSAQFELQEKHLLLEKFTGKKRIPKAEKPDFESMAEEETTTGTLLYLFGSGSMSPERDLLLTFPVASPEQLKEDSLTPLYNRLASQNGGGRESLNLEGALIKGPNLYLLNRAGNQLIKLNLAEFKEFLMGHRTADKLHLRISSFQLPGKKGLQAGFSGACFLPGTSLLLFSATLEDTQNWIDDGEIVGSYLGMLDLNKAAKGEVLQLEFLRNREGKPFRDKLESISFSGYYKNGDVKLLAIADNDDGSTRLFEFRLRKPFTADK